MEPRRPFTLYIKIWTKKGSQIQNQGKLFSPTDSLISYYSRWSGLTYLRGLSENIITSSIIVAQTLTDSLWDIKVMFGILINQFLHNFNKNCKAQSQLEIQNHPSDLLFSGDNVYVRSQVSLNLSPNLMFHENHDIAIAMSSSCADPVLGKNIQLGWLGVFKFLIQCHCTDWGHLNI